jgi:predicted ATPase
VSAHRVDDTAIELRVDSDMFCIADVGFGVSQTLPVLVALRAAGVGQLVYLEEPEIHLPPRAQVKLADILADAAKRGVRVVAETHSTLLLTAIQTLVAKGELKPDLVKLHWFQRDPKTGVTQVTTANLDENGAFGDWPEDFDDVTLKAESAYLDAVEGRQVR